MIEVSDDARAVINSGAFVYYVRASAWLGSELLAESVPIPAGSEESDRSLRVPERVNLTVPRQAGGRTWAPADDRAPLAAAGQTLKIDLGVGVGLDGVEWFQRGEFLITESVPEGQSVRVTAAGLLTLIDEAEFVAPFQPSGTMASTLRKLVEPALTVDLADAPTNRAVPTSAINWDSDRLAALYELVDAWAADIRVHEQGYLVVTPDEVPTVAVRAFTDLAGGTVVETSGSSTREGGFNLVLATGYAADGGEVRGAAYVTGGPWSYGGVATPLPVPFGYASPLLTTVAQCNLAARTVLLRKLRAAVLRRFTITCPPDPTLQIGDAVTVTTEGVDAMLCTVESMTLPYVPGPMTVVAVSVE